MKVFKIVTIGKYRRPIKSVNIKAEDKSEAIKKAKALGVFAQGVRGYNVTKMSNVELPDLTLEFCAKEIVKNNAIRIGKSILAWCYDGTVSVDDWNGNRKWFPKLSIEAIQYFIDCQPV